MKIVEVAKAINAAKRFIAIAEKVRPAQHWSTGEVSEYTEAGKDSAAAKRASLDLTRQLAQMRKL